MKKKIRGWRGGERRERRKKVTIGSFSLPLTPSHTHSPAGIAFLMHSQSSVVYFHNSNNELLRDVVILDLHWIYNAIHTILTSSSTNTTPAIANTVEPSSSSTLASTPSSSSYPSTSSNASSSLYATNSGGSIPPPSSLSSASLSSQTGILSHDYLLSLFHSYHNELKNKLIAILVELSVLLPLPTSAAPTATTATTTATTNSDILYLVPTLLANELPLSMITTMISPSFFAPSSSSSLSSSSSSATQGPRTYERQFMLPFLPQELLNTLFLRYSI